MTTEWNGQGLPPAAMARMERGKAGGPHASLFGISGQAALEACGFSVVGEVMGCIVHHIGFTGYGGCGWMPANAYGGYGNFGNAGVGGYGLGNRSGGYGMGGRPGVRTSSGGGWAGFAPYVDALYHGYDTAVLRMLLECRDLRGDGVVGVTLEQRHLGQDNREFIAYGTAVRAHSKVRPANLFSTTLPAHDVAKLLHGGWAPAAITIGISLAIRHDDWATLQQARAWAGNTEVSGYTELVHHVRQDARQQFARRTAAYGADGAIMSDMSLDIWDIEPGEGHRDHVALSFVHGTAIAQFHKGAVAPTSSLIVLPMSDPPGAVVAGRKP
ncbi:MAG: heavy metal-binding domain-containing protein [Acidimicrobiales bacterium]|jgi:uncharacterized protein YbjQ (UPF0145 family)